MKTRLLLLVASLLTVTASASAQKSGGSTGGKPSAPGNVPSSPNENAATTTTTNTNAPGTLEGQNGIYVTGSVAMQDGSEVPMDVVIEKICNNHPMPLGYTDHKGHFSVALDGQNSSSAGFSDASYDTRQAAGSNPLQTAGNAPRQNTQGCEIRASYEGYHSESVNIGYQHSLDNPDVGVLILRSNSEGGGNTVSATTLNAPKNALKAYESGLSDLRKGAPDEAEKQFEKAVVLHPTFAAAWYELGHLVLPRDPVAARADLEKALAADPKYMHPYVDLALLASRRHAWEDAIDITDRGLRLDSSSFPELFYVNAAAHFNLKQYDDAEKKDREAIRLDTQQRVPKATQLLGYILAVKGDLRGATEQMRAYLATNPSERDADVTRADLAKLEAHINK
jgi:tetratricopeptide (TPR) repeat protein